MTRLFTFCLAIIFSSAVVAQATKAFDLRSFDRVSANSGIDVQIVKGSTHSIKVTGPQKILDLLDIEVNGDLLEVKLVDNAWKKMRMLDMNDVKAVVTTPRLSGILANGGSDVTSNVEWKAEEFTIKANGGADIRCSVTAKKVTVDANGGADVELTGSAQNAHFRANGGSDILAKNFTAEDVVADANGAADIELVATKKLKARANGGSDIDYAGGATIVDISTNGGSDITRH